jgi:hypothetical protein
MFNSRREELIAQIKTVEYGNNYVSGWSKKCKQEIESLIELVGNHETIRGVMLVGDWSDPPPSEFMAGETEKDKPMDYAGSVLESVWTRGNLTKNVSDWRRTLIGATDERMVCIENGGKSNYIVKYDEIYSIRLNKGVFFYDEMLIINKNSKILYYRNSEEEVRNFVEWFHSSGTNMKHRILVTGTMKAQHEKDFEFKNECNRCSRIWFLDVEDLEQINALQSAMAASVLFSYMGLVETIVPKTMVMGAQDTTTGAILGLGAKKQESELLENLKCPSCKSADCKMELVEFGKSSNYDGLVDDSRPSTTAVDEIEKLHELYKKGIIDEDEFKAAKARLLK